MARPFVSTPRMLSLSPVVVLSRSSVPPCIGPCRMSSLGDSMVTTPPYVRAVAIAGAIVGIGLWILINRPSKAHRLSIRGIMTEIGIVALGLGLVRLAYLKELADEQRRFFFALLPVYASFVLITCPRILFRTNSPKPERIREPATPKT